VLLLFSSLNFLLLVTKKSRVAEICRKFGNMAFFDNELSGISVSSKGGLLKNN
jgi:hypothetical protein